MGLAEGERVFLDERGTGFEIEGWFWVEGCFTFLLLVDVRYSC